MCLCWATRETFSIRFWSLCWVAWETHLTTSAPRSVTPYLLPGREPARCVQLYCVWTDGPLQMNDFGFSPISSILLCSREVERKASSLQECVTMPTSPELVARMLALSSERLTPAMEATSLMSSSSLSTLFQWDNDVTQPQSAHWNCNFLLKCSASLF